MKYETIMASMSSGTCPRCGGHVTAAKYSDRAAMVRCEICGLVGASRRWPRKMRGAYDPAMGRRPDYLCHLRQRRKWYRIDSVPRGAYTFAWGHRGYIHCDERGVWWWYVRGVGMRPDGTRPRDIVGFVGPPTTRDWEHMEEIPTDEVPADVRERLATAS